MRQSEIEAHMGLSLYHIAAKLISSITKELREF